MNRLCFVIFAGLFGCTQNTKLNLADLTFPEPHRTNSKLGHVDTTFFYYPQEDGSEAVFYQTFNKEGRIICDSTQPYTLVRYSYDSIGLLATRGVTTNGWSTWTDSLTYKFDADSLILVQRGTSGNRYVFYFNDKGKLIQSLKFETSNTPTEKSTYIYDGDLLTKRVVEYMDKNRTIIESNFFYSPDGMLDSSTLQTSYGHRQSWDYDSIGLLAHEWSSLFKGSQRVVHKMRR